MPLYPSPLPNCITFGMESTLPPQLSSLIVNSPSNKQNSGPESPALRKRTSLTVPSERNDARTHMHFGAPLSNHAAEPPPLPKNYRTNLTPHPSNLHLHCLARDRLRMWHPAGTNPRQVQLAAAPAETQSDEVTDAQLEHILDVMGSSWVQSTKETYCAGLLVFYVFCDMNNIAEDQRCPVNPTLLLSFLSSCAGSYSGSALTNFAAAIRAWHMLHSRLWLISHSELKTLLEGAKAVAPESSKLPKCLPFTPDILSFICNHLNLNDPLDAAIFACLRTSFYCIAWLGKFTIKTIKGFDPRKHIARSSISESFARHSNPVTKFHIPSTKTCPTTGEDTFWAAQDGPSDPKAVLANHFWVNNASSDAPLFAWRHPKGIRPLSKAELVKRIATVTATANLPNLKGHGLHIRGTLEYLLCRIPFDVMKSMGRWSSDTFTLYLRDHALILAPYMQASPALEPFMRYTQPPLC
ncbi:hypothetical protein DFJ58DRAFT_727441 [Suillus subalutaceus]|uniref:uncharacterized protein n=1 Tax=Suillus subalutaceus TaxID=48586 RepID=UPI001B885761|nr:uncharacterized protein DFJ58DRAFT_727441 [Suillus subalutaceus]KAG1855627.1 hypothetical protein DFJ58DRAFT_727441 [Suillus subalutaceus]